LRASLADYEVIEALPPTGSGQARFLCRAPERLHLDEATVVVTELAVDAAGWPELTAAVSRVVAVKSDRLLRLIEVGPDLDPAGAGVYLASEAAPGGTLGAPAKELDPAQKVTAVAEAAQGAHALHEGGVAHGAISSAALFLTDRGAVLGPPPFGSASGLVTRYSGWRDLATLDPELLRGEEPSRSSDIWALAATLHGALSDRPLYPGLADEAPVTAVQRVLFTRPQVDPSLPGEIVAVLTACLDPDPATRPVTAEEFADRLLAAEGAR
jgi:eukaryotic-like serine/threonine-protein kinase